MRFSFSDVIENSLIGATKGASTGLVGAATGAATEFVLGDNKNNNPDCSLNKTVIVSNAIGGGVGGYLEAKKEQKNCKN